MGLSRTLEDYLLPTFNALVQIPVLGWLPFALLLFGIGETLTERAETVRYIATRGAAGKDWGFKMEVNLRIQVEAIAKP